MAQSVRSVCAGRRRAAHTRDHRLCPLKLRSVADVTEAWPLSSPPDVSCCFRDSLTTFFRDVRPLLRRPSPGRRFMTLERNNVEQMFHAALKVPPHKPHRFSDQGLRALMPSTHVSLMCVVGNGCHQNLG